MFSFKFDLRSLPLLNRSGNSIANRNYTWPGSCIKTALLKATITSQGPVNWGVLPNSNYPSNYTGPGSCIKTALPKATVTSPGPVNFGIVYLTVTTLAAIRPYNSFYLHKIETRSNLKPKKKLHVRRRIF